MMAKYDDDIHSYDYAFKFVDMIKNNFSIDFAIIISKHINQYIIIFNQKEKNNKNRL